MQNIFDSIKFTSWKKSLLDNDISIRSIDVLNSIHKPNGELLFGLINIDARSPDGRPLLPTVLIRGDYVCILTCLLEKETNTRYYLLVKQRRVADGSIFYEHPAGMCDSNTDPWDVAVKEVKEETGLSITKKDLRLLYDKPLYSSPGLLDEKGYFFCCEISMSFSEIESFKNKMTGAADEQEFIETYICKEDELDTLIKNSSGVLLHLLYQKSINR